MVIGSRGHKLQPLLNLVFRRSSVQHPLLAGAMSECWQHLHNTRALPAWGTTPQTQQLCAAVAC
jgi:hypothetical protein